MTALLDILRTLALVGLVFIPLEYVLPARTGTARTRAGLIADTLHATIGSLAIRFGLVVTLTLLAPRQPWISFTAHLPLWAQYAILLLTCDFIIWAVHRAFHAVPVLWRFHRIHHSSEHLDWLSTSRVHPFEQIVFATAVALPIFTAEFSRSAVWLYVAIYTAHSYLLHANTRLGFGPLEAVFTPPSVHQWHHANQEEAYDKNFGSQLVIWDKMFGTAHRADMAALTCFGVDDPPRENFAELLITPFRPASPTTAEPQQS